MNDNIPGISTFSKTISAKVSETIYSQTEVIKLLTAAMVIGGHVLLEGPPGIAKTLLARTFADSLKLNFKRIQFTPDLMPSDITGVSIFDPKSGEFKFTKGPIFTDILLADEINRATPKTQSALLEAMEELQCTFDGETYPLSPIFLVIATQNPIEHEGTFPLPEAQLDRFIFKINLTYPPADQESLMIAQRSSNLIYDKSSTDLLQSYTLDNILELRKQLREIKLSHSSAKYVTDILLASRKHSAILLGASPRAGVQLSLAAKFNAILEGRDYVIPDDIKQNVFNVLNHRLILKPEAYEYNNNTTQLINEIIDSAPIPNQIN